MVRFKYGEDNSILIFTLLNFQILKLKKTIATLIIALIEEDTHKQTDKNPKPLGCAGVSFQPCQILRYY